MTTPKNYTLKCETGEFILTGNPANLTVSEVRNAIEQSELIPDIKKTIIRKIIDKLIEQGIDGISDLLTELRNKLNDPDLWNTIIEIINSINAS